MDSLKRKDVERTIQHEVHLHTHGKPSPHDILYQSVERIVFASVDPITSGHKAERRRMEDELVDKSVIASVRVSEIVCSPLKWRHLRPPIYDNADALTWGSIRRK